MLKDVALEQRMLHKSAIFNIGVATASLFASGLLVVLYFYKQRGPRFTCEEALVKDESQSVEFKSSFRWDYREDKPNKEMERVVVKTVAGFLNSQDGGVLVIGVDDNKTVLGLGADYKTLGTRPNRDGFEQALQQTLTNAVGVRNYNRIKVDFCNVQGHEICVLRVSPASGPVYVEERTPSGTQTSFYLRTGNTTKPLTVREAVGYAAERWGGARLGTGLLKEA